jgi:hypothetical protein
MGMIGLILKVRELDLREFNRRPTFSNLPKWKPQDLSLSHFLVCSLHGSGRGHIWASYEDRGLLRTKHSLWEAEGSPIFKSFSSADLLQIGSQKQTAISRLTNPAF